MKNSLKFAIAAGAIAASTVMAFSTPSYGNSILFITDGLNISNMQFSASGVVSAQSINEDGWTIVAASGTASPPATGAGTAQFPLLQLTVTANYTGGGTASSPLNIYFVSGGFGPSIADFSATINGSESGTSLPISFNTWYSTGPAIPDPNSGTPLTTSGPISPSGGFYNGTFTGGPLNQATYSLGEDITLIGSASGSLYSISGATLTAVPEPASSALVALGIGTWALVANLSSRKTRRLQN